MINIKPVRKLLLLNRSILKRTVSIIPTCKTGQSSIVITYFECDCPFVCLRLFSFKISLRDNAHLFSDFFEDGDSAVELFGGVSCRYHTADTSGAFGYGGEHDRPDE